MKNRKLRKALLALCCAIALVAISVGATLAYLTSTDKVTNTFTVGNVKITLDETDVDDSTPNANRDQENSYKLMPGQTYVKDPIVHVAAKSEDSWIFIKVKNEIDGLLNKSDDNVKNSTTNNRSLEAQIANNKWIPLANNPGVYYKEYTSSKEVTDLKVFEGFTIRSNVTGDELEGYDGKTIIVNAYAIQKEGFSTAAAAWNAYQEQTTTPKPTSDFFSSGMPVEPVEGTNNPGI